MPTYLLHHAVWSAMWPVPAMSALVALALVFAHKARIARRKQFVVLVSFALLGAVTGVLAGFSRTPAMGAVLPAVLSLVAGLAIYLVGAGKADQGLVAVCVIALAIDLLIGSMWGAVLRDESERDATSLASRKREALMEVELRDFRRDLGLPDVPPSPAKSEKAAESKG